MTSTQTANPLSRTKDLVLRGAARFMQPIVRLLLRAGITHAEFSEMCKAVFVIVAGRDYGIRGRQANSSRIAILTGLGRKQVKHQKDLIARQQIAEPAQMSPAARVISAWHEDPEFLDKDHKPVALNLDGKHPSFESLAKKYAGDVPYSAVLRELQRVKAVVENPHGKLDIVSRSFLATELDPEHIRILSTQLQDLGNTIVHNLEPDASISRRLQRFVVNEHMPPDKVTEFQRRATEKAQELLEEFDGWLSRHEVPAQQRSEVKTQRTGVGVYFFENSTD